MSLDRENSIVAVGEMALSQLRSQTQLATKRYIHSIKPIFGTNHKDRPEPVGSCVFIEVRGKVCLVTAAHVVEYSIKKRSKLFILDNASVELPNSFFSTASRLHVTSNDDRLDFAFAFLNEEFLEKLTSVTPIPEDNLFLGNTEPKGQAFALLGFPCSKNRKRVNPVDKVIRPSLFPYSHLGSTDESLATQLGVSEDTHVLVPYDDKYSMDREGRKVSSVKLEGMSGGGCLSLGNYADPEIISGTKAPPTPTLAGIIVEYHKKEKAAVATRMKLIYDQILRQITSHD